MKFVNKTIALILCFAMLFSPCGVEIAAWAQDAGKLETDNTASATAMIENINKDTSDANDDVGEANNQLQDVNKVSSKWWMGKGTKRQISAANSELDKGKAEMSDTQALSSEESADAIDAGNDARDELDGGGDMGALAQVASTVQGVLIKIGGLLKTIGDVLKNVGMALMAIGQALSSNPFTAAIGAALLTAGGVMMKIGTALYAVGTVMETLGNGSQSLDQTFGSLLSEVPAAAEEGWTQGGADAEAFGLQLDEKADSISSGIDSFFGTDSKSDDGTAAGSGIDQPITDVDF